MKILLVGDTHFPWTDYKRINRILDKADRMQPDIIAQMGDLYDFYSWSRHPKSLNLMTPKDELEQGRGEAEAFWEALRTAAPKAKLIQILGNHDTRIERMVESKAPELEAVLEALDFRSLWRFKGVETQPDARTERIIEHPVHGSIYLQHGHYGKLGQHAAFNGENTVCGHSHKGGVVFDGRRDRTIWELNVGFVADPHSKVMSYTAQKKTDTIPGYGVIDNDGPRFNPLP